jgi:hypothetical protein
LGKGLQTFEGGRLGSGGRAVTKLMVRICTVADYKNLNDLQ